MIAATDRKKIARLVLTTNDDSIIEKIKMLVSTTQAHAKEDFIKNYNSEIDKAVKEVKQGKYYTQEQADSLLTIWEKE